MIILRAAELTGDFWATALFGPVGSITTLNDKQLVISARLPQPDPLTDSLQDGIRLGLLGIDFATRHKNRLNGVIQSAVLGTLSVDGTPRRVAVFRFQWRTYAASDL